jgi:protoporphyrinogen oxidase
MQSFFFNGPFAGLPDLSWYNIPKREKINQITVKYSKMPQNIPNGRK